MRVAISPCPNDTFLFFPWILGFVGKKLPIEPHYYDIQELNEHALKKTYPLIKLSFATYARLKEVYELLPIGAALGETHGPKLISKKRYCVDDLAKLKVAIPGKETTAHLLLQMFAPAIRQKHFCLYHEIVDLLRKDKVDAGVIIHETRFTFAKEGFYEIADLGELFYAKTKSMVPLGGLVLSKEQAAQKEQICALLQESLAFATAHPEKGMKFILEKSQEKDPAVVKRHIDLYVNKETALLSQEGRLAIDLLTSPCSALLTKN